MSMLRGELWLMVPGVGLRSLEDLKATPSDLDRLSPENRGDPNGALGITDEIEYVMVEDALNGVSDFFFDDLPELLNSGQGATYDFRSGPEQTIIELDGGDAILTSHDDTELRTPVEELLKVLETLSAEYEELSGLLATDN